MNWRNVFVFVFVISSLSVAYIGNEFFVTSEHYFVCFSAGISMLWFCIRLFSGKGKVHISVLDMTVLTLITYLAFNSLIVSKFSAEYLPFCTLCCCWVIFVVAKQQMELPIFVPMVIFLVLLSGVVQCIWGLLQYFNIIPVYAGKFKTVGSFQNSGVYANYLVCIFPMALAILLYSKKEEKKLLLKISWLFTACYIFIMPFTLARTAWLGMLAGALVVTEFRYSWLSRIAAHKKKPMLIIAMAAILIVAGMTSLALYQLKPESAQGRLFIYKITLGMCKDHPITGTGFNTFAREYNLHQAGHFASGAGSDTEKWLAGTNQVAFNEYLQITAETGLIGLMLLFSIGASLICYRKKIRTPYAVGAIGGLAALACCAFFSYPFHEIPIIVLAGWMLLIVGYSFEQWPISLSAKLQKSIVICFLLVSIFLCYYSITTVSSVSSWKKIVTHTTVQNFDDTLANYARLYAQLENNPYFLYNYGIELVLSKEYERSIPVLQRACRYFSDTDVFCYLGDAYKGLGQYEKSEANYWLASSIEPNKFRPLYCLVKLYHETGDFVKATELATVLIHKKEKVKSYTTYKIRKEMKNMIDTLSIKHSISK